MQVLNGSLVALVTPMMPDGEIDFDALNKIIDWHIQEGVLILSDINQSMLSLGRDRLIDQGVNNFLSVQLDAQNIPKSDVLPFDAIVINCILL